MKLPEVLYWLIPLGTFLLSTILYFEKRGVTAGKAISKFLLSSLFLSVSALGPYVSRYYYITISAGLFLCLVGDVMLAFPSKGSFRLGLVCFLAGHCLYIAALLPFLAPDVMLLLYLPLITGAGAAVFARLSDRLGDMKRPVILYMTVISLMLFTALSTIQNTYLSGSGRFLVAFGAFLFYVSDLFVARNRFIKNQFINRILGLPLYYTGQFLLAFSVGEIG